MFLLERALWNLRNIKKYLVEQNTDYTASSLKLQKNPAWTVSVRIYLVISSLTVTFMISQTANVAAS